MGKKYDFIKFIQEIRSFIKDYDDPFFINSELIQENIKYDNFELLRKLIHNLLANTINEFEEILPIVLFISFLNKNKENVELISYIYEICQSYSYYLNDNRYIQIFNNSYKIVLIKVREFMKIYDISFGNLESIINSIKIPNFEKWEKVNIEFPNYVLETFEYNRILLFGNLKNNQSQLYNLKMLDKDTSRINAAYSKYLLKDYNFIYKNDCSCPNMILEYPFMNIPDTELSHTARNINSIEFFLHSTNTYFSNIFNMSCLVPSKCVPLIEKTTFGNSYVYLVGSNNDSQKMIYSNLQNINDSIMIFSPEVLDGRKDWFCDFWFTFGERRHGINYKNFEKMIPEFNRIIESGESKGYGNLDSLFPYKNEFTFDRPISLLYCHYVYVDELLLENVNGIKISFSHSVLLLLKKLCPNTIKSKQQFGYIPNIRGINYEFRDLNYDMIVDFCLQHKYADINNLLTEELDQFRMSEGIFKWNIIRK